MQEKPRGRIDYITLLSVLSAYAVVQLHTNRCFWPYSPKPFWTSALVIECICGFCVPIFFMISGATLIDYRERYSTKEYFIKRFKRAFIPYVVWCYIGLLYNLLMGYTKIEEINLHKIIITVLSGDSIGIYWFFPILFGIYLSIPLFAAVEKPLRKNVFLYLIIASILVNTLVHFIRNVFHLDFTFSTSVHVAASYLVYVLAGYWITHYDVNKIVEILVYIMGLACVITQIIGTYYLSNNLGALDETYKGFENFPCIMYSIAVFMLIKRIGPFMMRGGAGKLIKRISSYTLGIYLIHWYVLEILENLLVKYCNLVITDLWYRLISPLLIIPICILIIWILRKIPVIKYIVP